MNLKALMPERAQLLEAVAKMDDEQLTPEKAGFGQGNAATGVWG